MLGAVYCCYYYFSINEWHFIDNVNLIIHEAGHLLFLPFGTKMMIAGGSMLQIITPTLFIMYFHNQGQIYASRFMVYWLVINLFNVGRYAADAKFMQLELLGGDNAGHDWNNLLSMTGLLNRTEFIANTFYLIGFLLLLIPVYFAIKFSWTDSKDLT